MQRREFLAGAAALTGVAGVAPAGWARADDAAVDDLRTAAREAWLYCAPLIRAAGLRAAVTGGDAGQLNQFIHWPQPVGPRERHLSAPEPDVLYSWAFVYVNGGAATFRIQPTGGRYQALAIFDMYGNVLKTATSNDTGDKGLAITVQGPASRVGVGDYTVPEPRLPSFRKVLKTNAHWVWAVGRTVLDSPEDLGAAQDIQNGLTVAVNAKNTPPRPAEGAGFAADWSDYFYAAQLLIDEDPPPALEALYFRRISPLQLGMNGGFERARFADADTPEAVAGVGEARVLAGWTKATEGVSAGWLGPQADLGDFAMDYLYRAQVALVTPAALPTSEALVLRAAGADGALSFPSDGHYRLTLPAPPPADGLWSLTLYEVNDDGQLFLADNPIGRFSFGDRSRGLVRRPDGGFDIWIGRNDPGGSHTPNWLPAPAQKPFALVLRAYLPSADLISGAYRLAPLVKLGASIPTITPPMPVRRRR